MKSCVVKQQVTILFIFLSTSVRCLGQCVINFSSFTGSVNSVATSNFCVIRYCV